MTIYPTIRSRKLKGIFFMKSSQKLISFYQSWVKTDITSRSMLSVEADRSEWERCVIENRAFQKAFQILCDHYQLPKPSTKAGFHWMDKNYDEFSRFRNDLDYLLIKYSIPPKWSRNIECKALFGEYSEPSFGEVFQGGWPPSPKVIKDHPRLKKDWRPVWEWHKKNPEIRMSDLARMIGCSYGTLRRKMSEIDKSQL